MNKSTKYLAPYKKKSGKYDIIKTFEIFNRENISRLKDKLVEIILVEADNIFAKSEKVFDLDFKKNKSIQISVYNDKNTYDLLSNTWKRYKLKHGKLNDKNK